jgi:hypothetical protein
MGGGGIVKYIFLVLLLVWGFFMIVDMYTGGDWKQDLTIVGIMYLAMCTEN